MYTTGQSIHPINTVFGAGFIVEHHLEGDQRKLPAIEQEKRFAEFVRSLRGLVSDETPAH